MNPNPIIAIDGLSGTGKKTAANRVADLLNFESLDVKTLYRAIALTYDGGNVDVTRITMNDEAHLMLDGNPIPSSILRPAEVDRRATEIRQRPDVRKAVLSLMHTSPTPRGLVAPGRTMGTFVFPEADLKIYLTAILMERADRIMRDTTRKPEPSGLPEVIARILTQDQLEKRNEHSHLAPAEGAIVIDTTYMLPETVAQTIKWLWQLKIATP